MNNIFYFLLFILFLIFFLKLLYVFLTRKNKIITIKKKYKLNSYNFTSRIIVDEHLVKYLMNKDIVISSEKCENLWSIVNEDHQYKIDYYGFDLPLININYRIFNIDLSSNSENS